MIEAFVSGLERSSRNPDPYECDHAELAFNAFAQQLYALAAADISRAATRVQNRRRPNSPGLRRGEVLTIQELRQRWNNRRTGAA
jgi:hypothetical protein